MTSGHRRAVAHEEDDISTFDFLAMMISMIPSIGTLSKICELSAGLYWRGTIVNFWHVKVH